MWFPNLHLVVVALVLKHVEICNPRIVLMRQKVYKGTDKKSIECGVCAKWVVKYCPYRPASKDKTVSAVERKLVPVKDAVSEARVGERKLAEVGDTSEHHHHRRGNNRNRTIKYN